MKRMLSLLIALVVLFSATAAYAAVPGISQSTPAPSSNAAGVTIRPIDRDTAVLGHYVLPDGYSVNRMIYGVSNGKIALKSLETPEDDQLSIFKQNKLSQGKIFVVGHFVHIFGAKRFLSSARIALIQARRVSMIEMINGRCIPYKEQEEETW